MNGNPWVCDCQLVWISHWIRRWLREVLQIHMMLSERAHNIQMAAREAKCLHKKSKKYIPILNLNPEILGCHMSALSSSSQSVFSLRAHAITLIIVIIFFILNFTKL